MTDREGGVTEFPVDVAQLYFFRFRWGASGVGTTCFGHPSWECILNNEKSINWHEKTKVGNVQKRSGNLSEADLKNLFCKHFYSREGGQTPLLSVRFENIFWCYRSLKKIPGS